MSNRPTPKRLAGKIHEAVEALGEQSTDRDRMAADYLRRLADSLDPAAPDKY